MMTNLNVPRITAPMPLQAVDFDRQPEPAEAATDLLACCTGNCNQGDDCPRRLAAEATALPWWFLPAAIVVAAAVSAASLIWPWGWF